MRDTHPQTLADQWRAFAHEYGFEGPRLEIRDASPSLWFDLIDMLADPAVGAEAVYVREDEPAGEVRWNWPLRVGFPRGPAADTLRTALGELVAAGRTEWRSDYIQLLTPRQTGKLGCHVLLMPGALSSAAAAAGGARAALAMVLGGTADPPARTTSLLAAVRTLTLSWGVAQLDLREPVLRAWYNRSWNLSGEGPVPSPETLVASWFVELVRELSHNRGIDGALFALWRRMGSRGPAPRLVAARQLVDDSRIGNRLLRLGRQFQEPDLRNLVLTLGPQTARRLRMKPGSITAGNLGRVLAQTDVLRAYDHEGDTGTAVLNLLGVKRKLTPERKAAPERPDRPPRWVQARVFEGPDRDLERDRYEPGLRESAAFRPGATHSIAVFVGPREAGAIQPPPNAPSLPEDYLPDGGVTLTVVFVDSDPDRRPQVGSVVLPQDGRSTHCYFSLAVPEGADQVEARIIILYRNRVLQTAVLRGPVSRSGAADERERITIEPEAVVFDRLDALASRTAFGGVVVLNHNAAGWPGLVAAAGTEVARFELPPRITEWIAWFDGRLKEVALDPDRYAGGLRSEANVGLLRELAQNGALLWEEFDYRTAGALAAADRVQVVSVNAHTRLPVEYFYDRVAPLPTAGLCPGAEAGLRAGRCGPGCPTRTDASVVCPLGFWGLSKVLERHLLTSGERPPGDELRPCNPVDGRTELTVLGDALFAASSKVDEIQAGGVKRVNSALARVATLSGEPIASWEEWKSRVTARAANLLLLMPHVVEVHQPAMQIGDGDEVLAANVSEAHVCTPTGRQPPPVVILLGCQTGSAEYPFATLVGRFHYRGAAAVLCTGSPVVGRHAVPVAEALLTALKDASGSPAPRSLGDVIRDVRRRMVLAGLPMLFTVLAFGDFDWQNARSGGWRPRHPARREEVALVTP
jgi:hypothetical protein